MWRRFAKKSDRAGPGRLTSVLSTKHGKHGSEDRKTEVPRRTLVTELDAQSDLYSTQALEPDALCAALDTLLASPQQITDMGLRAAALAQPDAAERIVQACAALGESET